MVDLKKMDSIMLSLPPELLEMISQTLPARDLANFRRSCQTIASAILKETASRLPATLFVTDTGEAAEIVFELQDTFEDNLGRIT